MASFIDPQTGLPVQDRNILAAEEIGTAYAPTQAEIGPAPYVAQNAQPTGNRRQEILDLYDHIDQEPDAAGVAYWMGRTDLDYKNLKTQFRGAAGLPPVEFEQPATDYEVREDQIREMYREELGREPDAGGMRYWLNKRTDLTGDDLRREIRGAGIVDNDLYKDPAYAAFMRGNNQQAGTVEADRIQATRNLQNQQRIATAKFDLNEKRGLEKVNDEAESRGMYRSGGRIKNRGDLVTDIGMQRGEQAVNNSERQNTVQRDAANELARLSRERDKQEVVSRNNLTNKSIQDHQRAQL